MKFGPWYDALCWYLVGFGTCLAGVRVLSAMFGWCVPP